MYISDYIVGPMHQIRNVKSLEFLESDSIGKPSLKIGHVNYQSEVSNNLPSLFSVLFFKLLVIPDSSCYRVTLLDSDSIDEGWKRKFSIKIL